MKSLRTSTGYAVGSLLLLGCFFASALLFCTSMLSTSTVLTTTGQEQCPGVRPVDQVVLVLIDAMRPDFVLSKLRGFSRDDGGCKPHPGTTIAGNDSVPDYYSGPTLRYMQDAINDPQDASHGFFLVADPPTTTAQRIKAIATGTMPAFLEAGSNFNSDATPIDSIVRQAGGRAVVLGDDTWTKLFPGKQHWKRSVAIPSFDVADFHTNDNAVLGSIYDVLSTETAEESPGSYAKLIVGHFLGIDHVGHRLNAANRDMDGKITQLNAMLHNVSQTLRTRATKMNTMLLVLGDHGMTQNGDHGGDTALETDTFLFAQYFRGSEHYPASHRQGSDLAAMTTTTAKKAALKQRMAELRQQERADPELVRLDSCRAAAGVTLSELGAAYQVDVTPTVSVLLGHPIPYSSFGRLLPEVLALADEEADLEAADACNERQMARYFAAAKIDIPAHPPWERTPGNSARERIAAMSFYARRTRTDMNMKGMIVGGLALIACALSAFGLHDVQEIFIAPPATILMGFAVLVIRWAMTLANSFIVYEDIGVFGLFVFYCLVTYGAKRLGTRIAGTRQPASQNTWHALLPTLARDRQMCAVLGTIALARGLLPYVLKHRFHITHAVESESLLDVEVRRYVWGTAGWALRRAGIFVGAFLWAVTAPSVARPGLLRRRFFSLATVTCVGLCVSHGRPVAHHVVPVTLLAVYTLAASMKKHRRGRGSNNRVTVRQYVYFVWVLWTASLCNEQVVASVVIASYGVLLPPFIALLHGNEVAPASQAVLLHLLSFVAFFMEGHQCLLSTIDWNASFVGMPAYSMLGGGILVLSRTFNAFLFVPVAYKLVVSATKPPIAASTAVKKEEEAVTRAGGHLAASFPFLRYLVLELMVVQAGMSAFSAFIQRHHLMLFPIFCPKLLFDVVTCLMTGVGVLLSYV